ARSGTWARRWRATRSRRGGARRLHQLEPISERGVRVDAVEAFPRGLGHPYARVDEPPHERAQAAPAERRGGPLPGAELRVDAEVDLHGAALEPGPAPRGELRRLRALGDAEQLRVEAARVGLSPGGHRELDVVYPDDGHSVSLELLEPIVQERALRRG